MNARRILSSAASGLPTFFTLLIIGAVAYVGHRTNWTMPRSGTLLGNAPQSVRDDWCMEHGVPESTCVLCKGDRVLLAAAPPAGGSATETAPDWCGGHGVPESICTRCNEELIAQFKARGDWCKEHNLPESQCTKCNPELKAKFEKMDPRKKAPAATTTKAAVDWCTDHKVPKSGCTQCKPELIATFKASGDWCGGHKMPESQCVECNPELKGKFDKLAAEAAAAPASAPAAPADWCGGHGVPESVCTRCNAELIPQFKAKGDWCKEHNLPESQCIKCNPSLKEQFQKMAPKPQAGAERTVQLANPGVARSAGIEARPAERRAMTAHLEVNAEVRYDATRYAQVSSRVGGTVTMVGVKAGDAVKRGDVLAVVDSADVGKAKAEFLASAAALSARKSALDRVRASTEQGFRNKADLLAAEAEMPEIAVRVFNARQALVNLGLNPPEVKPGEFPDERAVQLLGLPDAVKAGIDPKKLSANLIAVLSPMDGTVLTRSTVEGEAAEAGKPLFVVADTNRMWVTLHLPVAEVARVKQGQKVTFRADGLETPVDGAVVWISTQVDDKTRTVEVRAEVPNADGRLLANMFGRATLDMASTPAMTVVPAAAVQWDGTSHVVFVKKTDAIYTARNVRPGLRDGGFVAIGEIAPGDPVVVCGAYALLSQLNRAKLGAGCTDDH